MKTSILSIAGALLITLLIPSRIVYAGNETQNILINEELQIPGAVLTPGRYALAIAEQYYDRTIVKISRADRNEHYFALAAPTADAKRSSAATLAFFRQSGDDKAALKAWGGLEFVYNKAEAVKITAHSGETVLAVDPVADKLPVKMSRDDMKVVTLWSISPKQLADGNRGTGVTVVKYASASDSSATVSMPPVPPAVPVQVASTPGRHLPKKLPKTASNNYTYLLYGAILLSLAAGIRTFRVKREMAL